MAHFVQAAHVGAQPPAGTGSSPPVGPSNASLVVPPAYADPLPSPSFASPRSPSSGLVPAPLLLASNGGNPWATPTVVEPSSLQSASRAITPPRGPTYDPRMLAEYERLPRRGPFVALIVFASLGIVSGLPTLVRELQYPPPHDRGTIIYGATLTGVGVLVIALSAYKLIVRRKGLDRLRARGFQVSAAPARGGASGALGFRF